MQFRHILPQDYRRTRWKNDGGWTTELAVHHGASIGSEFEWRISIADVERDGDFSTFPQCDRRIALLDGAGMHLDIDGATVLLDQRLRFVSFAGESQTSGKLLRGPVRDFNVIARRDLYRIETLHRRLNGKLLLGDDAAKSWFVYLVSGEVTVRNTAQPMNLKIGESLLLTANAEGKHIALQGSGDLVLIGFFEL